ncbi:MAG: DUF523 domain-containing protein [Clostridia bacterium]|nr:DUF523 domain-containing protein [Clostridia bacterium]
MTKLAVSACLLGTPCRYDGGAKPDEGICALAKAQGALPICPECLGGLPTPRLPSEVVGGDGEDVLNGRARVLDRAGNDVTEAFIKGAEKALALCLEAGVNTAVLKARSPSCGVGIIYDGSFSGQYRAGMGVTAALLKRHGITLRTEEG